MYYSQVPAALISNKMKYDLTDVAKSWEYTISEIETTELSGFGKFVRI